VTASTAQRFAYADPPYPGQAQKHYSHDDRCAEVNHTILFGYLAEFDGWALSTSSVALRDVLDVAPADVRVAAWVKPFASFKPGVNPGYTWEPVLFRSGRKRDRSEPTVKDHIAECITLRKGLAGAKPEPFCRWVLDLIGWRPGDEIEDVFPGTGVMGRVVDQLNNATTYTADSLFSGVTE